MGKLSADLRSRAQKELQSGVKASAVAAKFGISASACSYLKSQATGKNPGVAVFEEEFNSGQLERFARLLSGGETLAQLSKDYETSIAVLKSYCAKHSLSTTGGVIKLPKTKKIRVTQRGSNKKK
jgi:AraC-like DNA-binding protein